MPTRWHFKAFGFAMSDHPDCLFCRMVAGKVPAAKLIDDEELFAIRDINPRAPVHILVIPKKHIPTASDISEEDGPLLARMTRAAAKLAAEDGLAERGYRLAFNVRGDAGMTVWHLHLHVVGGRRLGPEG
ncbi:MAG TPA: histidine triad nucleotide-binding protein [Dehalococcoidia bacterium]